MAKERIGLMGGTFNPIHSGHIAMAKAALTAQKLDEVLVIPSGNPPHKHDIAPAEDRWRMVCAACAQEPSLTPSRIELDRQGVIYSVDTLEMLRAQRPKAELFFIIGADTLMELHAWRESERVLSLCTFLICPRSWSYTPDQLMQERKRLTALGGRFVTLATDVVNVSSTQVRQALQAGEPTPLLPVPVREYCSLTGLYGMPPRFPQSQDWLQKLFAALSVKRFAHSLAVAYTARRLARVHGLDQHQAETAGLLHDCAKCMPLSQMRGLSELHNLTDDPEVLAEGRLQHSLVGAYLAATEYGVTDPEVLRAIASHTTGKPGMSRLEMLIYLADKIETTRESYPVLEKVRMLSELSLERAALCSMEGTIRYLGQKGKTPHPTTGQTAAWLKTLPEVNNKQSTK